MLGIAGPAWAPLSQYAAEGLTIWAYCAADITCGHYAKLDLLAIVARHGAVTVPDLRRRLRCTGCKWRPGRISIIPADRKP